MEDLERKKIAAEMIAADLERLKRQADTNALPMLAYLIEIALAEARQPESSTSTSTQ